MTYAVQPIEDVKEYFGEKIALYFAFIGQVGSFIRCPQSTTPCVFSPFLRPALPGLSRLPVRPLP
jgi:hypothetical protein